MYLCFVPDDGFSSWEEEGIFLFASLIRLALGHA